MARSHKEKTFAKMVAAACVRRGQLEGLHAGITPISHTGDYSDVFVVDAEGRRIPWTDVSRIDQAEMKDLMVGVIDRLYTFFARTLFAAKEDVAFNAALDRTVLPWIKDWDEPHYLPNFLMPTGLTAGEETPSGSPGARSSDDDVTED